MVRNHPIRLHERVADIRESVCKWFSIYFITLSSFNLTRDLFSLLFRGGETKLARLAQLPIFNSAAVSEDSSLTAVRAASQQIAYITTTGWIAFELTLFYWSMTLLLWSHRKPCNNKFLRLLMRPAFAFGVFLITFSMVSKSVGDALTKLIGGNALAWQFFSTWGGIYPSKDTANHSTAEFFAIQICIILLYVSLFKLVVFISRRNRQGRV